MHLLDRGADPKPLVLDFCKPLCTYWKEKLERCESKLQTIIKINPTKTCLYPMRDYVTCVEACVSKHIVTSYRLNPKCTTHWWELNGITSTSFELFPGLI
mmetsp:Transcript_33050/g.32181  ORF Transcript_33050/g.32181 Transcript_33050/m.32181 type:complete len:100 (+) Transcript_33050:122-421(+)